MRLANFFPIWDQLTDSEKNRLEDAAIFRAADRGTQLHGGDADCIGLLVVCSGQLRAYILNDEGREITLYRLFDHDICLFSASCMLRDIQFDIFIEAETDCELWIIPTPVYKEIMDGSAVVANYTNRIISSRFSEVMWLMEQVLWKSFDKRLASFLLDEMNITGDSTISMTHEKIASHLGTAREVVTRMLKYFQSEGLVKLSRGTVEIIDKEGLEALE